jgi:hypothetical protein
MLPRLGGPLLGLGVGLMVGLLAACLTPAPGGDTMDPQLVKWADGVEAGTSVLVRGRILPSNLVIEPVFQIDAPASLPTEEDGSHRLRGFDETGDVLFDLRFEGVEVAGPPEVQEEHFSFVIPLGPAGSLCLERVELDTADGRRAVGTAVLSRQDLLRALEREDAVTVRAVGPGRVNVLWDVELFPAVMVRDPTTGSILSFGRGGEATVMTELEILEVAVSDGVRSLARTVQVR